MSFAAALVTLAIQAAAPCTAEEVRTASVPPAIAWADAPVEQAVPADQRRYFTAALGAEAAAIDTPDFGFVPLPMSPYDAAFFAIRGETMTLHLCRGATCRIGYEGPHRAIAWASTFTDNLPDLAFDRSEVRVFNRGRYRRVCRVTFETP